MSARRLLGNLTVSATFRLSAGVVPKAFGCRALLKVPLAGSVFRKSEASLAPQLSSVALAGLDPRGGAGAQKGREYLISIMAAPREAEGATTPPSRRGRLGQETPLNGSARVLLLETRIATIS